MFAQTCFSLRYGVVDEKYWLNWAILNGHNKLVIADTLSTSAIFPSMQEAQKCGLQIIPAIDIPDRYILVAQNWNGFAAMNSFLSTHLHNTKAFPERAPQMDGVIVIYSFNKDNYFAPKENEYIGVRPTDLNRINYSPWKYHSEVLMAAPRMRFRNKRDYNTHRLLRAIDANTILSALPIENQAPPEDVLLSYAEIIHAYRNAPHLLHRTERILDSCCFHYTFLVGQNKSIFGQSLHDDVENLKTQSEKGLLRRYQKITPELNARLEKEIDVIIQKGFVSYFLIAADIVQYARNRGFFHVGRGSGANSLTAYCMGITDVDPIDLNLYFERFINLHRESPPDFDLDFSWRDRDEVIAYIFKKHGSNHTALLATYNTFQYRATVREMGKVFGLTTSEIDLLASGGQAKDALHELVLRYSKYIEGLPNHLSIHAGGILIPDKSIYHFSPTFLPPKGFPTVQFDMYTAENVGLYKFDILSQRGLGHIREAVNIIAKTRQEEVDIHDIPRFKADPKIQQLLQNGDSIGAFYVESPAMRQLLRKMQCKDYISLVAASSIIRPGVARSGMMQEYIRRYRDPEARKDAHPVLMKIMPETFGIMVYQEDVIKVAHYFAGLSLAEADILRRAMSGKYRSKAAFDQLRVKYFNNCRELGHPDALAIDIWRQIESFAGYSFAKGHSASFAVESYQSLFLRAHYPLEFITAVINNRGGFYSTETYLWEARKMGAKIERPSINEAQRDCALLSNNRLMIGWEWISGLETQTINRILTAREKEGPFYSMEEVFDRVRPGREQMLLLIRAGALREIETSKQKLYWQTHQLYSNQVSLKMETPNLFQSERVKYQLPELEVNPFENYRDDTECYGFPLDNPFHICTLPPHLKAEELKHHFGKRVCVCGYLVSIKPTRTLKGERMYFGTFFDTEGEWLDTTHFPKIANQYPFRGRGVYAITGIVDESYGTYSINVEKMERLQETN